MSNVAVIEPRPNLSTGARPSAIVPQTMDEAYRLGKAICMAGMAPKGMDTPEKCMIAIMRGMEVGMTPMMALDKIAIVNGRPTIWGDGAIGLVRGSGLCEWVKEKVEGTGDLRRAICEAKRKGEPEPISRIFSVTDAKKAGLWNKSGPWQQFPDRMLQMRARAFCLRDLFADVLGGLYLKEEIDDAEAPRREHPTPPVPPIPPEPPAPKIDAKPASPPGPPPAPPEMTVSVDIVEVFRTAAQDAPDGDALDAAWNEHVQPHLNGMDNEIYEALMAIDDAARGRLENV